ncbi:MAG: EthD family reductase [Brasilonema sp.]
MIKLICLINRPSDKTLDEFKFWWLNHHAKVAAKLPNLRRYKICTVVPESNDEMPFDGVAELYFDSREDMENAFASEQGQECSREDLELIGNRLAFITEEHVIIE